MTEFLHECRDFAQLIAIVAEQRGIDPVLVEKDYWIMHCLWGLQAQGFRFELKGGTSLSKAEYRKTAALYYDGQPGFDAVLARIRQHVSVM